MNIPADLNLEDLLPHRDRMLLIGEVLAVDAEQAVTRCVVDASWPLASGNSVAPLVMVELAAQTAGVCNGLDRIRSRGPDSDATGWLVGVKNASFYVDALACGSVLVVRAENRYVFGNLREVSCEIHSGETLIGRAVLQLFQAE